jgi:transposase
VANNGRDAGKERFWRGAIKRQASSRLSVRAFCERERLTEIAFYAWRRTIAERDAQRTRTNQPAFLPLVLSESAKFGDRPHGDAGIEITLAAGRILRLPVSTTPQRVAEIVRALDATITDAQDGSAEAAR